jgi:hypothetical protein
LQIKIKKPWSVSAPLAALGDAKCSGDWDWGLPAPSSGTCTGWNRLTWRRSRSLGAPASAGCSSRHSPMLPQERRKAGRGGEGEMG